MDRKKIKKNWLNFDENLNEESLLTDYYEKTTIVAFLFPLCFYLLEAFAIFIVSNLNRYNKGLAILLLLIFVFILFKLNIYVITKLKKHWKQKNWFIFISWVFIFLLLSSSKILFFSLGGKYIINSNEVIRSISNLTNLTIFIKDVYTDIVSVQYTIMIGTLFYLYFLMICYISSLFMRSNLQKKGKIKETFRRLRLRLLIVLGVLFITLLPVYLSNFVDSIDQNFFTPLSIVTTFLLTFLDFDKVSNFLGIDNKQLDSNFIKKVDFIFDRVKVFYFICLFSFILIVYTSVPSFIKNNQQLMNFVSDFQSWLPVSNRTIHFICIFIIIMIIFCLVTIIIKNWIKKNYINIPS